MNHREVVENVIKNIDEIDYKAKEEARRRVDSLAKPLGSLGKLEDIAVKLSE